MTSLLILTMPYDDHADAVRWAMTELGHTCKRWFAVPPVAEPGFISIDMDSSKVSNFMGVDGPIELEKFNAVWDRRLLTPGFPIKMAEIDQKMGAPEMRHFVKGGMWSLLYNQGTFLVNDPTAKHTADNKVYQLEAARLTGLNIPNTLFTNDSAEAQRFVAQAPEGTIYKSFKGHSWTNDDFNTVTYASLVTEDDFGSEADLEYCPGIFQHFKPKAYELRVSIFGHTAIAAKISNQNPVDWRSEQHSMTLEPYTLPSKIETLLFQLMARLGIVMGMADLIVTEDGEYVFLEINEQGQFTWVESRNPEICVIEPFARFLASRDPSFKWKPAGPPSLTLRNYLSSESREQFNEYSRNTHWPEFPAMCLQSAAELTPLV